MLINCYIKLLGKSPHTCPTHSWSVNLFPNLSPILSHTCQFNTWTESQTVSENQRIRFNLKTGTTLNRSSC